MEDHSEAYFAWKRAGIRDAWCWHVDAHLDVGRDGFTDTRLNEIARCQNASEAAPWSGNCYLPWGGLHCGNYLYPAIRERIVNRLSWIIPPDLVQGGLLSWARAHLNGWLDLTVEEAAGLREEDGIVRGQLLGIPFELGTLERVQLPDTPVLLDIDIDYFLTAHGEVWNDDPGRILQVPSLYTTVAYSVRGGYTPDAQRRLASPWVGDTTGYQAQPIDHLAALSRQAKHSEVIQTPQSVLNEHPVDAGYLVGSSHYHLGNFSAALACWKLVLDTPGLPPDGQAYLLGLSAEALCRDQQPQAALKCVEQAMSLVPADYRLYWASAIAWEQQGDLRQATKMVRRGLQLAEPYVFALQMRLVLARLYKAQGKQGLASMELERLEKADLLGQLRPLTLLR